MKPIVYFSRVITPENSLKLFKLLGINLKGRTAVKIHSGEDGNQNFIPPEFFRPLVFHVTGTVCECNAAYGGQRDTTEKHVQLMNKHRWTKYFKCDICDSFGDEAVLEIPNGLKIKQNIVGSHLLEYDSLLVITHFKGHPMGGFGGALKQLSIGCASANGKAYIHSGGTLTDPAKLWENLAKQEDFIDSMADAASSVAKYFEGRAAYVNIAANLSRDCDCCAVAENPCMNDIGIFASLDPIAIDKACLDAVTCSNDPGKEKFLQRVEEKKGARIIDSSLKLGFGSADYQLICID